jgi:1,4-dihydroxy-2-naphthoate octaprenyltransferase
LLSVALLSRATRAKTLPVILSPVMVGATLAWTTRAPVPIPRPGMFVFPADLLVPLSLLWLGVTLLGAALLHLGANVLNDYFDERSGAEKLARLDRTGIATGSGLNESGVISARGTLELAAAFFSGALVCGIVLAVARGWQAFGFGTAGAFLAWQYVGLPLRYGYVGRGLGEVGIFLAFGFLPVVGSYYVQTLRIDATAMWASAVPGALTTLVLYHHHFLHWRADRTAGKMSPVAVLGPERAMIVSGLAIIGVYVTLVAQVAIGLFPAWSLTALATAVPLAAAWSRAFRDPAVQNSLNLLGATLGASVLTGVAISLSLVAPRLF